MRNREDVRFDFLIGKTIDEARSLLDKAYFIVIGENEGRSIYISFEYNPSRIVVSVYDGKIYRIDKIG